MIKQHRNLDREISTPRRSGRLQTRQDDLNEPSTSSTVSLELSSPSKNVRTRSSDLRGFSSSSTVSVEMPSPNKRQTRSSAAAYSKSQAGLESIPPKIQSSKERALNIGESEVSDAEGDILATRPIQRRRGRGSSRKETDFVVDDGKVDYASSSDEDIPLRPIRQSRTKRNPAIDETQSESEKDIAFTPSKRKRATSGSRPEKSPKTVRYRNRQDALEIAEDLEDLRDSSSLQPTRTGGRAATTERDRQRKLLDRLKRKRAGEKSSSSGDSMGDSSIEDDAQNLDVFHGADHASNPIEISSDSEALSSAASGSAERQLRHSKEQDLDADDEGFIVSDPEEDSLGVPTASLPFQFSHHASAKPRDHFKNVVEWLVKNKIAPAFSRHDDIYDIAFRKVSDEIQGQTGSRYRSAAWNKEFVTVLDARPLFHIQEFDGSEVLHPRCEACNRTNHPATWEVAITGDAYDKNTLEPIDAEDEDAGENDEIEHDINGNALPAQTRRYYLGKYCAFNAEMTHKLSHWKWHLNDWLLDLLEREGVLSAEAIVAREKLSQRKREAEAENIVDGMEENLEMDRLWRDFKTDKERAREGMEDQEGRQSTLLREKAKGRHGGGLNMFVRP